MSKLNNITSENLFLLEFLVDKVTLSDKAIPPESAKFCQETCVCFQFLDNAPLDICEADFVPRRDYDQDVGNLKSGKSCLFALTACQAEEAISSFNVSVCVFKKMEEGVLPEKLQVGTSVISISNLFNTLIESLGSKGGQPAAKTMKDSFPITDADDQTIGNIVVFIRMSCFGKLIVTQFQMNLDEKCVLFKDKEGNALYRYKKVGKGADGDPSQCPGAEVTRKDDGSCACLSQADQQQPQQQKFQCGTPHQNQSQQQFQYGGPVQQQYSSHMQQSGCYHAAPPSAMPYGGGGGAYPEAQYTCDVRPGQAPYGQNAMGYLDQQELDQQQQLQNQCNQQCFQEIGAEMAGNALKIRVHRDPKTSVQKLEGDEWHQQQGQPFCPYYGPGQPGAQLSQMQQVGQGSQMQQGGQACPYYGTGQTGAQPFQMQQGPQGSQMQQPSFGGFYQRTSIPGAVMPCVSGRPEDPTAMTMTPGSGTTNPVALKMASCPNAVTDNNVTVIPPCPTGHDGIAQVTEIPDPTKDVFVLRIGKKTEGNDKRSNLELELQTPKGIERKPPAKKETRETQCEDVVEKPNKKGGKGKGKKDKKGGGKKKGGKKK